MSSQKVLGLDLSAVTLPDAIAAMVDAWLEAQGVERPSYEIDCEGQTYYDWWKWADANSINHQTARAYIQIVSSDPTIRWIYISGEGCSRTATMAYSDRARQCITKLQAAKIERLIERRDAGESLQQLRRNPDA